MALRERFNQHDNLQSPELDRHGKYALVSVYEKEGIEDLAESLVKAGYHIISTGGTAQTLQDHGIDVIPIEEVTKSPEGFDGRVKTISYQTAAGILYLRDREEHVEQAEEQNVYNISFVVNNLYPFEETVQNPEASHEDIIEEIDVGGPTMIRSAAKNYKHVTIVTDPEDYATIAEALDEEGEVPLETREELAAKAFHLLSYDNGQVAKYTSRGEILERTALPLRRHDQFRYGENPHQNPAYAYFVPGTESPLAQLKLQSGREMSHTNLTDIDAGLQAVRIFDEPAAAVIKHNTPCGIALGDTPAEALLRATAADPKSVFGGVAVLNAEADMEVVEVIRHLREQNIKLDIIASTTMEDDVVDALQIVRKSTGIYTFGEIEKDRKEYDAYHFRAIDGGMLIQPWDDDFEEGFEKWSVPTDAHPTDQQIEQAQLAWKFLSRIRSNSVVVVDSELPMTLGIGTGQTARIYAAEQAVKLAGKRAQGAIMASDSFFPFDDCVDLAGSNGISLVVQQGGSIRDQASIDAANHLGIPMIFTNTRAFWH